MRISNLRIVRAGGWSRLEVDVEAKYTSNSKLWYAVPTEYEKWLSDDVYDAFLVSAIYPAMYYNENIVIEGNVSKELYFNLRHYVQTIIKEYRNEMHFVDISVKGFAKPIKAENRSGTGFSAGVDSFATFHDRYDLETDPELRVSALFFFNVGSHGGGGELAHRLFDNRYAMLSRFTDKCGLPFVKLDSNLFDFYLKHWEYDAGIFCRASAILTLQRGFSRYYISSTHAFSEWMTRVFSKKVDLASLAEGYLTPMLSTSSLSIILDGAQYTRAQKVERIADLDYVKEHLNVCVRHDTEESDPKNCSVCSKCLRTLIALESLGMLDKYANVFDISAYRKVNWKYKCNLVAKYGRDIFDSENVDFARAHGLRLPSRLKANFVIVADSFKSRILGKLVSIVRGVLGETIYEIIRNQVRGNRKM